MIATPSSIEEKKAWKDYLNRQSLERLAAVIKNQYPAFTAGKFVEEAYTTGNFQQLELTEKVNYAAGLLKKYLPKDFKKTTKILIKCAPEAKGFSNWILTAYVQQHGLEHFEESIATLKELTKYGTAEFAIKPFIIEYTDKIMPIFEKWLVDPNEHVRRLVAEGTRPRGVWTQHIEAFKKDPTPVIALLEQLKTDESLYVRKAVANNLNDISREQPKIFLKTVRSWKKDKNKHTEWIIKHASRTLIKKGHPEIFEILGYAAKPEINVKNLKLSPTKIKIGDKADIKFELHSLGKKSQKLVIDFKIHYLRKDGKLSKKVFKLAEKTIKPSEKLSLNISRSFANNSTRKHFPGKHKLEILINGRPCAEKTFSLS